MLEIPKCPCCKVRPVAVNYQKNGKTYYRSKCNQCYRANRKIAPSGWIRSGYKKRDSCERCRFRFKIPEQASVVHVDGNVENCDWLNLKTICANCAIEIAHSNLPWKPSTGITPDF